MMFLIAVSILGYQILLGVFISLIMIFGLYVAKTCELVVDFFLTKK